MVPRRTHSFSSSSSSNRRKRNKMKKKQGGVAGSSYKETNGHTTNGYSDDFDEETVTDGPCVSIIRAEVLIPCFKKVVHFKEDNLVEVIEFVESEEEKAERKKYWEFFAVDRNRFKDRIAQTEDSLRHILLPEHRDKIYLERFKDFDEKPLNNNNNSCDCASKSIDNTNSPHTNDDNGKNNSSCKFKDHQSSPLSRNQLPLSSRDCISHEVEDHCSSSTQLCNNWCDSSA